MKKIILFIVFSITIKSLAQHFPLSNQYTINKASFITSYSGFHSNFESFMSYGKSLIGIDGAPEYLYLNVNGNLMDNMGLGINFQMYQHGNFSKNIITASYAYHLQLNDEVFLSFAVSPLFFSSQYNVFRIKSHGFIVDPFVNTNSTSFKYFDIGTSLSLWAYNFYFGSYACNLLSKKYADIPGNYSIGRQINFLTSYTIKTPDVKLEPSVAVILPIGQQIFFKTALTSVIKNKIISSVSFSSSKSLGVSFGFTSFNSIVIKYDYELFLSEVSKTSIGNHEITIAFLIKPGKKFNSQTTYFEKPTFEAKIDDKKIAEIDQKINKEQLERKQMDDKLQKQIDSLKNIRLAQTQEPRQVSTGTYVQKVISNTVVFGFLDASIQPASHSELEKYATKLQQDPDLRMKIIVYTDNLFNDHINLTLSRQRAKALYDYFCAIPGINPSQIEYEGRGSAEPIADNTTFEGRLKNNRVEFLFSKTVFQ